MTDRELLEAAARAAGMDFLVWTSGAAPLVPAKHRVNDQPYWHPLSDDGDALRLAVKLGLMVDIQNRVNATSVWTTDESGAVDFDVAHGTDPYASTRRAITRAAAEIGTHKEGA